MAKPTPSPYSQAAASEAAACVRQHKFLAGLVKPCCRGTVDCPGAGGVAHNDYCWETNPTDGVKKIYNYVGHRVRKDFGAHGVFEGTVTEVDRSKKPVYAVLYDDGDREHMEWHNLRSLLLSGETESALAAEPLDVKVARADATQPMAPQPNKEVAETNKTKTSQSKSVSCLTAGRGCCHGMLGCSGGDGKAHNGQCQTAERGALSSTKPNKVKQAEKSRKPSKRIKTATARREKAYEEEAVAAVAKARLIEEAEERAAAANMAAKAKWVEEQAEAKAKKNEEKANAKAAKTAKAEKHRPKGPKAREGRRKLQEMRDEESHCFTCKDGGDLLACDFPGCPKVYHANCVGLTDDELPDTYICPAHACRVCETQNSIANESLSWKSCRTCPASYCKDCLPAGLADYGQGYVICLECYRYIRRFEEIGPAPADEDDAIEHSYESLLHSYWTTATDTDGPFEIADDIRQRLDKALAEGFVGASTLPPPRITPGTLFMYEWEGRGRQKHSFSEGNGKDRLMSTHYGEFARYTTKGNDREVFSVGDCIAVFSDEGVAETVIARIDGLFEDTFETSWAQLTWFFYPTDKGITEKMLNSAEGGPFMPGEIFTSNHMETMEISCIHSKRRIREVAGPEEMASVACRRDSGRADQYCYWRALDINRRRIRTASELFAVDSDAEALDLRQELQQPQENDSPGTSDDEDYSVDDDRAGDYTDARQKRKRGIIYQDAADLIPTGKASKAGIHSWPASIAQTRPQHIDASADVNRSAFTRARDALKPGVPPASMPCREVERGEILTFLRDSLQQGGVGRGLYISGVPGTGKTATVYEVVRALKAESASRRLPDFRFVEINGMSLPDPSYAFSVLHEEYFGSYTTPHKAADRLEKHFTNYSEQRSPLVLLLDEVDLLVTRKQNVLYKLLDWPTYPYARLIVIAIANTMDLPERVLPRLGSRLGLQRVGFRPYDVQQIEAIVAARLRGTAAFDQDAIEFCARKVASVSGDVRRALEICRRGAEIAEERIRLAKMANSAQPVEEIVTMSDVLAALKGMASASNMHHIQGLPLHSRLCLAIFANEAQRDEDGCLDLATIARRHQAICRDRRRQPDRSTADKAETEDGAAIMEYLNGTDADGGLIPLSDAPEAERSCSSDALATVCHRLAMARLVQAGNPKQGGLQVFALDIPPEDVIASLRGDQLCAAALRGAWH